jgi:O-antigen chain-terminating methyltransferase
MDTTTCEANAMSLNFYRAFEDRFRGSRELIKSRLQIYKPFIEPFSNACPAANALDLGCGRGEWLELLIECGFNAKGVDIDEGMLEACRTLNLDVEQGDALAYLESQPDQSHIIVSAFHVVEHINFAQLNHLVTQALRVLKPGGLLIMETPNSENILVGTSSFYLDPSHQRPIPSPLLSFVAEHAGFHKVKVLGLQESAEIQQKNEVSLHDVLGGVSPDYAVIAKKKPPPTDVITISDAFDV